MRTDNVRWLWILHTDSTVRQGLARHTPYATHLQGSTDETGTVKRKHQNRESGRRSALTTLSNSDSTSAVWKGDTRLLSIYR